MRVGDGVVVSEIESRSSSVSTMIQAVFEAGSQDCTPEAHRLQVRSDVSETATSR